MNKDKPIKDTDFMKEKEHIGKIHLAGQSSATLVIPKRIAQIYGMDSPCYVVLEPLDNGILIKKLDIDKL